MKKVSVLGILCVFMVFLWACEKSAPTAPEVPHPPTISSFTATPGEIFEGNNSTLSWSTSNATTVSIDQGIGNVSSTGSREVGPSVTTLYTLTATNSDGAVTKNCTVTVRKPWSKSGTGDSVFDMPTYVSRVRIIGTYTGYSSNFIVYVGGSLLVNELLGTGWGTTTYDGTLLTTGGVVEIKHSSGVSWSFTEVSPTTAIINTTRKLTNIPSQSDPRNREYEIYKRVAAEIK